MIAVSLAADPGGGEARLSIADTGGGIDEERRRRIFEPFFATKKVGESTGRGLAVVHGIVTSHGGRISVSSTVGAGTRFDVALSAAAGEERAAGGSSRPIA